MVAKQKVAWFCLLALLCGCVERYRSSATPIVFTGSGEVVQKGLPFSEAVRVGNTLYLSGQIGVLPGTTQLVPGGIREQTMQAMRNVESVLRAHGYSLSDLVRCTVMLADMSDWSAFNEVYQSFFSGHYPARSSFAAAGLALDARVEIECIAAK